MNTIATLKISSRLKKAYEEITAQKSPVIYRLVSYLNSEKDRLENEPDEISPFAFFECRPKNVDHAIKKFFADEKRCPKNVNDVFKKLNDVFGVRIICYSKREIYNAISFLEWYADNHSDEFRIDNCTYSTGVRPEKGQRFPGSYLKNYVLRPKDTGYRSIHLKTLVKAEDGEWVKVEVQVRSILMHVWSRVDHVVRYGKNRDNLDIVYVDEDNPECNTVIGLLEESRQKELPTITFLALFSISRLLNVVDDLISILYDKNGIIERDAMGTISKIASISDTIEKIL